ncbi:hypothetical protein AJ80_02263 [Polytolypa hystricis UAMH7299]|uniref:Peroxisomal membrane protein Pex17 n=1 Tax=Polytolypa hystricis (strain UAMH7299) TaxID=1447883 RepID=A0A2B7YSR3_POLH7|nr:hypothetical protein AJ80_02263 [Polytolypa hystricis UAMH7299]
MATERSLATLLRSLQTASVPADAYHLLPSTTGLLSILTNPRNVTLLSSQLLCSPALWDAEPDLQTCRRIISVFNTAAITFVQNELSDNPSLPNIQRRRIDREDWVRAVVNGADDTSPRWRHLLLLGGVLIGFESQNRQSLPVHLRKKLESALVKALQLALIEIDTYPKTARYAIALVLNYTFGLLADHERNQIDYNILLPLLVDSAFFSPEGLEAGYFLGAIDRDVREVQGKKFDWSSQSPTYLRVNEIMSRPLVSSLGPLSRLIAHSVESTQRQDLILQMVDSIAEFTRTLMVQWRQNKLSEVDPSEEAEFLNETSVKNTIPMLWRLLKSSMFAMVIILRAVVGRVLNDPVLAADGCAPFLAMKALHMLRNLCFVTARIGHNTSSQYIFVNLTAIDILSQYPDLSEKFLTEIRPSETGQIPDHPIDRCLDLFFLNTAEHFSLILSPTINENLLISAALPYLASGGNNNLLEIFEAAHSVVLSVLAAPASADMAANHLPFYVNTLFNVFPTNLSARQFRLAFKTVLQITAPPSPLANSQPLLPSILLELLYDRALQASPAPLLPPTTNPSSQTPPTTITEPSLSEQAVLTLTLTDCLCFLRLDALEDWLPLTARLITTIADRDMRKMCQERFWDALSSGEMDVERAEFCVQWWSTRGGREMVLFGAAEGEGVGNGKGNGEGDVEIGYLMSGGLVEDEVAGLQSKL